MCKFINKIRQIPACKGFCSSQFTTWIMFISQNVITNCFTCFTGTMYYYLGGQIVWISWVIIATNVNIREKVYFFLYLLRNALKVIKWTTVKTNNFSQINKTVIHKIRLFDSIKFHFESNSDYSSCRYLVNLSAILEVKHTDTKNTRKEVLINWTQKHGDELKLKDTYEF